MSTDSFRRSNARNDGGRKGVPSKRSRTPTNEAAFRREFAIRVRDQRKHLGLTQGELAQILGVSQERIAHYETGRGLPRTPDLPLLCRALSTDPNTLLGALNADPPSKEEP